jgi:hypothetical protein
VSARLDWSAVLDHAAAIVDTYSTWVTLRQLFYRLVADGTLPNLQTRYRQLSARTAQARREDWFPELHDRTSAIEGVRTIDGPDVALDWLRDIYRRDRTEGQPVQVMLGVEKAGLSAQLSAWFTEPLGIPRIALGGYAAQTLCGQLNRWLDGDRPSLLIYAGDHDPTGEDIDRDLAERTNFDKIVRVALSREQVHAHRLPFNPDPEVADKLKRDPHARRFRERHGDLVQYEVDALPPETLRELFAEAIAQVWDVDAYQAVLAQENIDHAELAELADHLDALREGGEDDA